MDPHKCFDFLHGGRQPRQIKRHTANQSATIRSQAGLQPCLLETSQNKAIELTPTPSVLGN